MRNVLLLLLVSAAYIASAVPAAEEKKDGYSRYIQIPDGEGVMHTVDLEAEPDMELLNEITRDPADNLYLLYTRRNQIISQTLVINDAASVTRSNFNANVPTVVIAHGWLSNQHTSTNAIIRNAYLRKSDVNVIVCDWRRLASSDYVTAVRGVPAVGRGLGQFLAFINRTTGQAFNQMHIIGFSLGAHLVGNAGRELGGRAARVTALDPAGPLWNLNSNRVNRNDGIYVEAIHTDGGSDTGALGIGSNVADADFYPNGGVTQPGCSTHLCNHIRAVDFFAATVTYNHLIGRRCTLQSQIAADTCRGTELHMGNDNLRKTGTGMYRVNTGTTYPF
ncbi:hypothetical protein PYW08_002753 [Mythimna loreyi]|uniref:Uncharacterized protein n=1 Tax=Mythimna loreyi TaxID=667449 RepID=A0ACC2QMV0_9NEOP|nr:hypothetical protein PYW08_002753 [Mythimna loreyi]